MLLRVWTQLLDRRGKIYLLETHRYVVSVSEVLLLTVGSNKETDDTLLVYVERDHVNTAGSE